MWGVVGLGNPGASYSRTRHNVGFSFIKMLGASWGVRIKKKRNGAKLTIVSRAARKVLLAMPQTFMNQSGTAVKWVMESYGIQLQNLIVVYDDFDIDLGEIRIRKAGRSGSHKGMDSIIRELGSTTFPRIRIGIGPLSSGMDPVNFVLSTFKKEERKRLEKSLVKAQEALGLILDGEIEKAMTLFNVRRVEGRDT